MPRKTLPWFLLVRSSKAEMALTAPRPCRHPRRGPSRFCSVRIISNARRSRQNVLAVPSEEGFPVRCVDATVSCQPRISSFSRRKQKARSRRTGDRVQVLVSDDADVRCERELDWS
ncbi:hypothetical protein C8Q80DRAFT_1159736 [Daedaleopsis nitida]|nr:hypothetical protein C8Q80DRAFT_1159736 [Daedaleopsis nitida]